MKITREVLAVLSCYVSRLEANTISLGHILPVLTVEMWLATGVLQSRTATFEPGKSQVKQLIPSCQVVGIDHRLTFVQYQ
jgi:hypothetical protein